MSPICANFRIFDKSSRIITPWRGKLSKTKVIRGDLIILISLHKSANVDLHLYSRWNGGWLQFKNECLQVKTPQYGVNIYNLVFWLNSVFTNVTCMNAVTPITKDSVTDQKLRRNSLFSIKYSSIELWLRICTNQVTLAEASQTRIPT